MRFEDLNWIDVERYLEQDDRVILITGACEQHGYLSLLTDVRIPEALADAAAKRTGVLVAPALPIGVSPFFDAYPGTISVRLSTFLNYVEDVVRDLHRQGFHGILVLNGHGGNAPLELLLQELANELDEVRLAWHSWWTSDGVSALAEELGYPPEHASWMEAFPFTHVAELPEGEKDVQQRTALIPSAQEQRNALGDGVTGGPYQAEDETMQRFFDVLVDELVAIVESLERA